LADIKARRIGDNQVVEEIQLDSSDITAKEVQLTNTPDPTKIVVHIVSGTTQTSQVDYIVVGDKINWDGRGMETILSDGERLVVSYSILV